MDSEKEKREEELTNKAPRTEQAEEGPSVFERMYQTLFEATHDAVCLLDGELIADCNHRVTENLGYSSRELLGTRFDSLIAAPKEAGETNRPTEPSLQERSTADRENGARFFKAPLYRRDGETILCEVSLTPLPLYGRTFYFANIQNISERTRIEQDLRLRTAQLQATLESLPFDFWINDTHNRTFMQNSYSTQLWGAQKGHHMEEVTSDESTKSKWRDSNTRALSGEVVEKEVTYTFGGTERVYRNITAPVREDQEVIGILGLNIDITDYKQTQRQLEESLRQVEVLLKEVHHRVKNNLQIIISLINLEKAKVDPQLHVILYDIQSRIGTMSLIHEQLYDSESITSICMRNYLENLTSSVASTFNLYEKGIAISLEVEDVQLCLDFALPLGLMANELVNNSIKHAFPQGNGTITIRLREEEDTYIFAVSDDGVGASGGQNRPNGLGLTLVDQLSQQIRGHTQFDCTSGYSVTISFPKVPKTGVSTEGGAQR